MIEWFYLAFGFALLSVANATDSRGSHRSFCETAKKSFSLLIALAILLEIDKLAADNLWIPAGRESFRWASLFLTALLAQEALVRLNVNKIKGDSPLMGTVPFYFIPAERNFFPLLGFSFWTAANGHYGLGLLLPVASGLFEWLLGGLWQRLELSNPPKLFEGAPLLFWLTALLSLVFCSNFFIYSVPR